MISLIPLTGYQNCVIPYTTFRNLKIQHFRANFRLKKALEGS